MNIQTTDRRGLEQLIGYIVLGILTRLWWTGDLQAWLSLVPFLRGESQPLMSSTAAIIELASEIAWGVGTLAILVFSGTWAALRDLTAYAVAFVRERLPQAEPAEPVVDPIVEVLEQITAKIAEIEARLPAPKAGK